MPVYTLKTRQSMPALRRVVVATAGVMAGRSGDTAAIRGIKLRIATAFFSKVKQAFVAKARGGRDEAGITWRPLDPKTLAYSRRGLIKAVKTKRDRQQADYAGRPDAYWMSQAEFKKAYREVLPALMAHHPPAVAKGLAKQHAIRQAVQAKGGPTKISVARQLVPGSDYEILRDTGVLLNSLSPGTISGDSYNSKPGQVVRTAPGELICGTNVAYAAAHHYGVRSRGIPARPLWPRPTQIPAAWLAEFSAAGQRGLEKLLLLELRRAG